MPKKKRPKQKPETFAHNPFNNLKGLSVSDDRAAEIQKSAMNPDLGPKSELVDDDLSFAEEMDLLGVSPLERPPKQITKDADGSATSISPVSKNDLDKREKLEFLGAVGQLDKTFGDQWPEQEKDLSRSAKPRRMKQLQKGLLQPDDTIDLHGMTRAEALHRIRYFLENAFYHGMRVVLVITGKGTGSEAGPVLKKAVAERLAELTEIVIEWGEAPKRYGGSGAFVVFLRKKTQDGPMQ